jgi:hypothetical protein
MSKKNQISTADAYDRGKHRIALATFAISVIFAMRAAGHVVGPETNGYLAIVKVAMQIVAVACVLSVIYWTLFKLPKGERHLYFGADGFVVDALNRAQQTSWLVTFLALMVLEDLSHAASFRDLPVSFYLQSAMALMLGVSSVVFFYLNRSNDDHEMERETRA